MPPANIHTFKVGVPQTHSSPGDEGAATAAVQTSERASSRSSRRNASTETPRQAGDVRADTSLSTNQLQLPDYITPLPNSIDPDILQLLHRRGALTVPPNEIIDELLRGFICYVYPLLPVVDIGGFLDAIRGTSGKTISLLLFQAVMMAGATFVDLSHLQAMNLESYQDARRIYYERIKLLYDLDVELNPTTMIQVLLLMTYWHGQLNDSKGRFYWLDTALSLATNIGLANPHYYSDQPDEQRFRRRLWACCIIRSHILSLTERRQTTRQFVSRDVEALQPDDLDDVGLARAFDGYYPLGRDVEVRMISRLLIQQVKLCALVRRILESQYELSGMRCVASSDTMMMLIPKMEAPSSQITARDQELRAWYRETTSSGDTAFGEDHRSNGPVLGVHSAVLELFYLTVLSAVHRPHLLYDQGADSAAGALQAFSCLTLRSAARRMTEIVRHLDEDNLVQFLPPIAVGVCIAASIQHLKDAMSADSELRSTGSLFLSQTLHVAAALKTKFQSVDTLISFIERVKGGKIFYHSVEWEDRVAPLSRWDNDPSSNSTAEEPGASETTTTTTTAETGPLPPLNTGTGMHAGGTMRWTAPSRSQSQSLGATPRAGALHDMNEFFNLPHLSAPDLDGYSELLLSSMDWSQFTSTTG